MYICDILGNIIGKHLNNKLIELDDVTAEVKATRSHLPNKKKAQGLQSPIGGALANPSDLQQSPIASTIWNYGAESIHHLRVLSVT